MTVPCTCKQKKWSFAPRDVILPVGSMTVIRESRRLVLAATILFLVAACRTSTAPPVCHPAPNGAASAEGCVAGAPAEVPLRGDPTQVDSAAGAGTETPHAGLAQIAATNDAIEVSEAIEFEPGSDVLPPRAKQILDEVAAILRANPGILKLQVEGHTDSKAPREINRSVSSARAKAVRNYLIGQGIAAHRLTAKGFGDKVPVADNATEEGRRKNRRIALRILKTK